ncbi:GGDEF domain-containing protein [Actinoplanes sp. NPDC049548]|uniref:GGDEF domain-containing protein n=1 Tax=Actinoplanes sp. NPDC049548 TaxID=3155152 RepID=UPI00341F1F35
MTSTSTRPVTPRRSLFTSLTHPRRFYADLRISTKIVSVALVVASVFAAVGFTGPLRIRDLAAQQGYQYRTNVWALSHVTDARSAVGTQLEAVLQRPDDTAARLGGDEFAVLLDGFDEPSDAYEVAERLLAIIARPLELPEVTVRPRASVGVALWNGHAEIDALIHDADVAMYAAKAHGKHNVVRFDQQKAMT